MYRLLIAMLTFSFVPVLAQEHGHRQLGAHEHGIGALNVALEGNKLEMELIVPGDDIVGFEHAPRTTKQKAAVENAKKTLSDPVKLFGLPKSAGCVLKSSAVEFELESKDAKSDTPKSTEKHSAEKHSDHKHSGHKHSGHKHAGHDHAHDQHAEFQARYAFECAKPAEITEISLGYFKAFRRTSRLAINLISPKGQSKVEVKSKTRSISTAGKL